jgi:hypothetical protein
MNILAIEGVRPSIVLNEHILASVRNDTWLKARCHFMAVLRSNLAKKESDIGVDLKNVFKLHLSVTELHKAYTDLSTHLSLLTTARLLLIAYKEVDTPAFQSETSRSLGPMTYLVT